MPIAGVSTDYSTRKKDISVLQVPQPLLVGAHVVRPEFGKLSKFCAGVQSLVQRYAIMFLTEVGSQPDYPDFGTEFLSSITGRSDITNTDVQHIFNFANLRILDTMRLYQADHPEMPLDEQLSTATLDSIVVTKSSVALRINIITRSEDAITFLLPLPEDK